MSGMLSVERKGEEALERGTVTSGAIVDRGKKGGFTRGKLVIAGEVNLLSRGKLLLQILDLKRVSFVI